MILEADADFHAPAPDEPEWAEVFSATFSNPDRGLNTRVYLLFRPQFGVVQTSVAIIGRDALQGWQADYADYRPHVPCPPSLRNFELANGLSLETLSPHSSWRLRFDDGERVAFDVRFDALMAPYSPYDPRDNPRGGPAPPLVGHFEQSGRFTGSMRLRDGPIAVDSISMMNHGWGPRWDRGYHGPTGSRGMTWLHAHFPDGYAVYGLWTFDLAAPHALSLVYGYVQSAGRVSGLAKGHATAEHDDERYPVAIELTVEDRSGTSHSLRSRPVHRSIWSSWPNMVTFCVFASWTAEGRSDGHGDIMEFTEIASLTADYARSIKAKSS